MAADQGARPLEGHWRDRPLRAAALRVAIVAVPMAIAASVGVAAGHVLPAPHTGAGTAAWWAGVLAASAMALVGADVLCRRLLPLAVLLELSLLFPDRAPSRFGTALRSGSSRRLRELLEDARRDGVEGDPAQTAGTILALVAALGAHHRPSQGHSERVRAFTDLIAEELHLPPRDRHRLRWAALLHDVGKVSVPLSILENRGPLRAEQWEAVRRHPIDGRELVAPLRAWLGPWATAVEHHHERWDGLGYPDGLTGEDISLGGRIVCVADSFEAMTAARSYQAAMDTGAARARLAELSGSQFDPAVVRSFLNVSVGRVRWALGPLAVLGGVPLLGGVARAASHVAAVGAKAAAVAVTVGAVAVAGGPTGIRPVEPAARPAVVAPSPTGSPTAPAAPVATTVAATTPPASGAPPAATTTTTARPPAVPPVTVPVATVSVVTVPPVTVPPVTVPPVTVPPVTVPPVGELP